MKTHEPQDDGLAAELAEMSDYQLGCWLLKAVGLNLPRQQGKTNLGTSFRTILAALSRPDPATLETVPGPLDMQRKVFACLLREARDWIAKETEDLMYSPEIIARIDRALAQGGE